MSKSRKKVAQDYSRNAMADAKSKIGRASCRERV